MSIVEGPAIAAAIRTVTRRISGSESLAPQREVGPRYANARVYQLYIGATYAQGPLCRPDRVFKYVL